jgi:streptomycin 6-kinase
MITKKYRAFIAEIIQDGEEWIEKAMQHIERETEKRNISKLQVCDLSYNMVFKGESPNGAVVIKVGIPHRESTTEQHALQDLNQDYMCPVVEIIEEDHITFLKQLQPGETLWTLAFEDRLPIAKDILKNVPTDVKSSEYPHHINWLENVLEKLKKVRTKEHKIFYHLSEVFRLYPELEDASNPYKLLHGDLHHYNILKDGETWKVIDPKGVYGHYSLEVGRFMLNQIGEEGLDKDYMLDKMVDVFSTHLKLSKRLILLSFYFDMTLSTSWTLEDGFDEDDFIVNRMKDLEWLHEKISE